jgi:hypothetical protein
VKDYRRSHCRTLAHLVLAALLTSALACDEDGGVIVDDDPPPGIVGTVLDADSLPVAGAPVGLIYGVPVDPDFWPPAEVGGRSRQPEREVVMLEFVLTELSSVRFLVQDFLFRPRRVLIDGATLPAGRHGILFDWADETGSPLPNGLYGTRLEITREGFHDVQQQGGILRNSLSWDFGAEIGPLLTTDVEGRFRIPFSELPIGNWAYCWDRDICTIPDTLWVQSGVPEFRARRLVRIQGFDEDVQVDLRWTQRPD